MCHFKLEFIMKKHFLYTLLLGAAFSFTACDEDFDDVAAPQAWPQEEAVTIPGFSATAVESIDLANAGEDVVVFNPQLSADLPEGAVIANYRLEVTPSVAGGGDTPAARADVKAKVTIQATAEGKVATKDLQAAIEEFFGKRPVERSMDAVLYADMMQGGQATLLTAASFIIKAKPKAPQISQHYYLIGDPSKWEPTEVSMPFNHSGKDVYEDPIFTIVFPVQDGETWFAVSDDKAAEANEWSLVFGCAEGNGENGMEGKLNRRSVLGNDGSWKVVVDGDAKFIKMTLNMMEYTYKLEKLNFAEYIYEVGDNNNWGQGYALHSPQMDGVYHAALRLNGGFKLRSNLNDWDGAGNWGSNAEKGILINDGGSGNIQVPQEGFYWVSVDLGKLTYQLQPFEKMGIIGDGQPGGWDSDTPMIYDAAEKCWKAEGVALEAGKKIKFRSLGTWDLANYGGSLDNIIYNAGDISIAESGTFTVKLYLETAGKFYAELIKE